MGVPEGAAAAGIPNPKYVTKDPTAKAARIAELEAQRKARLAASANADITVSAAPPVTSTVTKEYDDPSSKSFSLSELKDKLPNVNPSCRELYLNDEDFQSVFKMDKAAFSAQPKWKQANAKKQHGLF